VVLTAGLFVLDDSKSPLNQTTLNRLPIHKPITTESYLSLQRFKKIHATHL
jgi:hypothetical protein